VSTAALRVQLRSTLRPAPSSRDAAAPLLEPGGPDVCLGGQIGADGLAVPVQAGAATLFGPRGACLLDADGPLWACDTGHHRLLGWSRRPRHDQQDADWLIGQPDFSREGRNAKGRPSASTFNVPTGITACGEGLAVADAWNHRVLIWQSVPRDSNVPADVVLGQHDFSSVLSNRGTGAPDAASLFWPYGVHWDGARLWVADSGNRRVLMWDGMPTRCGVSADLVLGQRLATCRDENGGEGPGASSLRWPHAVSTWRGRLCVADAGNNRVMVWNDVPGYDNAPCNHVLGQANNHAVDQNQSLYWPNAASLNMPYGLAAVGDWLVVADTANSRLLGWHIDDCRTGAPARALAAQPDFGAKGDNRWQLPQRDSLCWPYGVAAQGDVVVIADSGNNRVLLWRLAPRLAAAPGAAPGMRGLRGHAA
jgi:hypothetical protein